MVIQRWQSVWLLVAAICVGLFCVLPMAIVTFANPEAGAEAAAQSLTSIYAADNLAVLIVGILTTLLLIIDIFSFKDLRRQKRMTVISLLFIVVLGVCAALMVYGTTDAEASIEWLGSALLLVGAALFAILAYRGIRHDEKLLRSADRLW